jgi:hypothetical protein
MNIFKQLAEGVQNTEVMYTVEKESGTVEFNGTIVFKKGGLERKKTYWARTYTRGEGIISIDEWDGDWDETTFNGIKIDNYQAFIKGFEDHGMKSIANSLAISHEEECEIIYQAVANHKLFKAVYKKARLFELFTPAETKVHHYNLFLDGKYVPTQNKMDYGWTVDGKDLSIEEVIELESK